MSLAQPKTDKEYEARNDAHTLKEASAINQDPKRLAAATKALKQIEKEAEDALKAIQNAGTLVDKLYPSMKKD